MATDFAGRSLARTFADDKSPYSDSLSKVVAAMTTRRGYYSTAASIAEVIFAAATDGTGQVMYLAGQDVEQAYSLLRSTSEQQRLELVRQHSGL